MPCQIYPKQAMALQGAAGRASGVAAAALEPERKEPRCRLPTEGAEQGPRCDGPWPAAAIEILSAVNGPRREVLRSDAGHLPVQLIKHLASLPQSDDPRRRDGDPDRGAAARALRASSTDRKPRIEDSRGASLESLTAAVSGQARRRVWSPLF